MYVCVYYIHLMYRLYVHVLSIACFPYCILLLMLKSCKMCLYTITCMHVAFQQSLKNSLSLSPTLFSLLSSLSLLPPPPPPGSLLISKRRGYLPHPIRGHYHVSSYHCIPPTTWHNVQAGRTLSQTNGTCTANRWWMTSGAADIDLKYIVLPFSFSCGYDCTRFKWLPIFVIALNSPDCHANTYWIYFVIFSHFLGLTKIKNADHADRVCICIWVCAWTNAFSDWVASGECRGFLKVFQVIMNNNKLMLLYYNNNNNNKGNS